MPPLLNQDPRNENILAILSKPNTVGAASLILMGIVAFAMVFSYLSMNAPARTEAAGVTAAIDAFAGISLEAKSVSVVDLNTGKTLYERNADVQLPLASLTKVPLTLVVADVLPGDTVITIPFDTSPIGSAQRLAAGDKWKVSDVINFTLVASSNEGANILSLVADTAVREHYPVAPDGSAVLWRMNDLARQIGLKNTYFINVNGLDESTTQSGAYGSARDIALLFGYAAKTAPASFAGTTRDGLLLSDESGNKTSAFNTNEALGKIPGLILGKTGFTDLAGGNLAIVFDVGLAHPVVAVVLGSTHAGRFSDMQKIVTATRASISGQ